MDLERDTGMASGRRRTALIVFLLGAVLLFLVLGFLAWQEASTSRWQAQFVSRLASEMTYSVEPGPSESIRFPTHGPFDQRLGYTAIPHLQQRLVDRQFGIEAQARISTRMADIADRGLFLPYREKTRAGLDVRDCMAQSLYVSSFPQRTYAAFEDVPSLLVESLLFIENRELLANEHATKNPAVEWDRLIRASFAQVERKAGLGSAAPGGSTLATQIEKFRHSPGGRTESAQEKLRQMVSASLRAYLDGPDTTEARRRLVVDYLNTVPLAGWPGYGDVNGIGDGLWVWYEREFDDVNALLADSTAPLPARALAYKQALSLLVSQRRPGGYLARDPEALDQITNFFVRLSARAGLIPASLRDAALEVQLVRRTGPVEAPRREFIEGKAATAVRRDIAMLLGRERLYELDRLDLAARSTLDQSLQAEMTRRLRALADPAGATAAGLMGERLLAGADPAQVTYSFTLLERTPVANVVRVQVDTLDQPLDINSGIKLDLGSTAKLRTLVTYLETVAGLHGRLAGLSSAELRAVGLRDPIGRWAVEYLASARDADRELPSMLEAALDRTYSASTGESFFTGGGRHTFRNFDAADDSRTMTVREAMDRSVNLVFVRLMRDVVLRTIADLPSASPTLLEDPDDPKRAEYLARFADREGSQFLARFHRKYAGQSYPEARAALVAGIRPTARRLAVIHRSLEPGAIEAEFASFIRGQLNGETVSDATLRQLYETHAPGRYGLQDRGYLAGVHPLELWLVAYLRQHPRASLPDVLRASVAERQEVYAWLFKTRSKRAQDTRIRSLIEVDAFREIHASWRRLGFPFDSMTPSYGAALGSSGDRPAALAELVGILLNDGVRQPTIRVDRLEFARGTPYETRYAFAPATARQVLPAEVARAARGALAGVVERGTARRLAGSLTTADGGRLTLGGKTGTGDHRAEVRGRGGALISSRVVSRSGTFVFFLGDRFFGTITAYVTGPAAGGYTFTSAMPTQILKTLAPAIQHAIDRPPSSDTGCPADTAVPGGTSPSNHGLSASKAPVAEPVAD
jgi:membrane peptidoglycan carboxypeptidase